MYERYIKRCLDVYICSHCTANRISSLYYFWGTDLAGGQRNNFLSGKEKGKDGTIFNMYKLRSMKVNAPDIRNKDNSTFNSADDPRVTKNRKADEKNFS